MANLMTNPEDLSKVLEEKFSQTDDSQRKASKWFDDQIVPNLKNAGMSQEEIKETKRKTGELYNERRKMYDETGHRQPSESKKSDLVDQLSQEDWFNELTYDKQRDVIIHYNNQINRQLKNQGLQDEQIDNFISPTNDKFEELYRPSQLEAMGQSAIDIATQPAKSLIGFNQFLWDVSATLSGSEPYAEWVEEQTEALQRLKEGPVLKNRSAQHEYIKWAEEGMVFGAGASGLMRNLGVSRVAPGIKNIPAVEPVKASMQKGAFTAGIADWATIGLMKKVVEPRLKQSDLSDSDKNVIRAVGPLLIGGALGIGPESVADSLLGNQAFTRTIDRALKQGMNPQDIAKSPELMDEMGKAVGLSPDEIKVVKQKVVKAPFLDEDTAKRHLNSIEDVPAKERSYDDLSMDELRSVKDSLRRAKNLDPEEAPEYSHLSGDDISEEIKKVNRSIRKKNKAKLEEPNREKLEAELSKLENALDKDPSNLFLRDRVSKIRGILAKKAKVKKPIREELEIVSNKSEYDVKGMRGNKGQHMNSVKKSEYGKRDSGWLGNPYKADDVKGGKLSRSKAIELFEKDFLKKVENDSDFRDAVLNLKGKKVGYYKPQEGNHLQVVKKWLDKQPGKPKAKTKKFDPQKLKFQQAGKEIKETSPGIFEEVPGEDILPSQAIEKNYPSAYKFLSYQFPERKVGFYRGDISKATGEAYKYLQPGATNWEKPLEGVRQLEDLNEIALDSIPKLTPEEVTHRIDSLVEKGFIDNDQAGIIKDFTGRLSKSPDFDIRKAKDKSFFRPLKNTIALDDPALFFHETGHWAWENILSKADRLEFAETLMTKYNSMDAWDNLIPARKEVKRTFSSLVKQGKVDVGRAEIIETHFSNPKELFADLVSQHVWNHKLTAPEFKTMIGRSIDFIKRWVKSVRKSGKEIPKDMQRFVNKVFDSPKPGEQSPIRFEDYKAQLKGHYLYMSKDEINRAAIRDPDADLFLTKVINEEGDLFRELNRGEINIEQIVDALWMETFKWHHKIGRKGFIEGALSEDELNTAFRRVSQMFEDKDQMIKAIARSESVTVGARRPTIDPQTGKPMRPLEAGERRAFAQRAQAREDLDLSNTTQALMAYRQIFNDTFGIFEGLKASKGDTTRPAKMTSQNHADSVSRSIDNTRDGEFSDLVGKEEFWGGEDQFSASMANFTDDMKSAARTHMFTKVAPGAISAAFGLKFDQEDGVPIPGLDTNITWDPITWATRGFSVGIPFSDKRVPIAAGPILAATAAGVTPRKAARGVKGVVGKMYDETGQMFPLVRRFVEHKRERARAIRHSDFVRSFIPGEDLPEDLRKMQKTLQREEMGIFREAEKMLKQVNENFTLSEQRIISDIIEKTGINDLEQVGSHLVDQAEEIKRLHRQVRESLEVAGFPKEAIDKLGDNYLHRIYSRRLSGTKGTKESQQLASAWKRIFGDYIHPRGATNTFRKGDNIFNDLVTMKKDLKKDDIVYDIGAGDERYYIPENAIGPFKKDKSINHKWDVEYVDDKKVILRRDWSLKEREDFGEIREVVPRMAKYMKQVSGDVALANMFRRLNETSWVVRPKDLDDVALQEYKNAGWVKLSDTEVVKGSGVKKYGALSGKMVHPEVKYLLEVSNNPRKLGGKGFFRFWNKLTRAWKITNTAFNPGTHGRNFVANLHMCLYDGKSPIKVLKDGVSHIKNDTELFKRALEAGMLDSQFLRSELNLDDFLDQVSKAGGKTELEQSMNIFTQYIRGAAKAGEKVGRGAMRAYELGDEIFKMGYIADEVAKGRTLEEGLMKAQESFFDYRDIPSGVKAIRDWGIMPFVTYTYKIIPKIYNTMMDNPHRLMGILLAYELINEASFSADYDERKEAGETFERAVQPNWMKKLVYGFGEEGTIRIPGQERGEGPVKYYDFMQNLPGGDVLSPHGVFGNYPFGFHPVASTVYGMFAERTPMLDKEFQIQLGEEWPKTKEQAILATTERLKFLMRTWGPNIPVPGTWSWDNLGNGVMAEVNKRRESRGEEPIEVMGWNGKDYHGTYQSLPESLIGFAGLGKVRHLYPDEEYRRSMQKLGAQISAKEKRTERSAKRGDTTKAELEQQVRGLKSLANRNLEIIQDLKKKRRKAVRGE